MDLQELRDLLLGPAGVTVLALLIVYGVLRPRPWWVPGWQYRAKEQECEEWKAIAMRGSVIGERVTKIAEQAVTLSNGT